MYQNLTIYLIFSIFMIQNCQSLKDKDKRILVGDSVLSLDARIQQLETKVQQLTTDAVQQTHVLNTLGDQLTQLAAGGCGGVLYIHWGKKTCPHNSTQVYSGFAGGSNSGHAGGAAEPLCMPRDPIGGDRAKPPTFGYVYGAEYETDFFGPMSKNEDIPCAVCISWEATVKMMLPGRNKCYHGWNELYHGYLAGNVYNAANAGNFVCMEEHEDFLFGGKADVAGRSFYGVITSCGSLQCPPYNESMPLTCVLCAK